jgi:hypothetical protein
MRPAPPRALDRDPAAERDPGDVRLAVQAERVVEIEHRVARFAALGSMPSGSGDESPKPGMSTAIASRPSASRSSTGDHWTTEPPSE